MQYIDDIHCFPPNIKCYLIYYVVQLIKKKHRKTQTVIIKLINNKRVLSECMYVRMCVCMCTKY